MPLSKSTALFRVVYLALVALMVALFIIFSIDSYLYILFFVAVLLLWVFTYRLLANRWMIKVLQILTHQCDPEAFIVKVQKLLQDRAARKRETYALSLQLWLGQGLIQSGKYDEAQAVLPPMPVYPENAAKRQLAIMHASLFTTILLHRNLPDNAATAIEAMRSLADPTVMKRKLAPVQRIIAYSECLLTLQRRRYEGAEEALLRFFDTAETPLNRVNIQYHLGELYVHFHQPEKARAAFQYAADHGNTLYAATQAREALSRLEQA
ncbi:MAG: hypothetical protein AAGU77_10845 [Bacillota bacterium]